MFRHLFSILSSRLARHRLKFFTAASIAMTISTPFSAHADCAGPAGKTAEIIYNADYKVMQYCNGTVWVGMGSGDSYFWKETGTSNIYYNGTITIGSSSTSCTAGTKGSLRYNDSIKRFEGCNGTDGWQPLAQSSPQLGTPLYAYSYSTGTIATYNNVLSGALLELYGNTSNPNYVNWWNMCHITGTIGLSEANQHENCGRFLCYPTTKKWAYMVQIGSTCEEGTDSFCNNGHFFIQWNCLNP